jgi:hypothetical protein
MIAAAALFTQARAADDAAKERREAADATREEVKQEGREAKSEMQQEGREARTEMREQQAETQREMQERRTEARQAAAEGEKKHPLFEGKNNFDVEGKIQKVSKSSITVSREDLPAATLNVNKDTKIELDGEKVSAAQLKTGQDVKASFNLKGDKAEAIEIKAEKP